MSDIKLKVEKLSFSYGSNKVLDDISLDIKNREILSIIGPAGSGKTTFLRSLNRLNDLFPNTKAVGRVLLNDKEVYSPCMDLFDLRRRVGMVFAVPVPLINTIYENIAYGPKLIGIKNKKKLDEIVEDSLRRAALWDEVKDRLKTSALRLSGGQQQRLCIARTLALDPEVMMLDEPCSGLDPISTMKIEENLQQLKEKITVILVTNNNKQAARASDRCAFFLMGKLIEVGATKDLFVSPAEKQTNDYITGKFG
ncbi:MAG: phosphate ABC transporter ATP-binding protein PstB [Armatimonadota bacterium]